MVADLSVPIFVNWKYHEGEASRNVATIAALFSVTMLTAVFVWAARSRAKRNNERLPRVFMFGAAVLALASAGITAASLYLFPADNYVEMAFSNTPLGQIHPQRAQVVVEYLRAVAANSKKYGQVVAQTSPISPQVYSPESFANSTAIQTVLEQYKAGIAIDYAYHEEQRQALDGFRTKMSRVDPEYLSSFEAGRREQEELEAKSFERLQHCADATIALYEFADLHSRNISLVNGQLHFANSAVENQFTQQLQNSRSLYEALQQGVQELAARQREAQRKSGFKF